jgi:dTDP-3,4-didehydro-2,6-dideoxy-alpha-D-glucose 3-reductase
MTDAERIRIGVIGCASIADRYVIPAIIDLPDHFTLIGVAGRDETKTRQFAEKFSTTPFSGYDALISYGQIDAVYIPLPNALHREWIEKALDNSLHVLVEKSLACSHEEGVFLNKLAEDKKLILVENFQFRFHSQIEIINRIIREGQIGELRYLRSTFGFPPFTDPMNIRYQASLGGGALLDAGAYTIKVAQNFLGNDLTVTAANLVYDPEKGIDIWGGAYLRQKAGQLFAEIAFGFDFYYQCSLEIMGSKGLITADRIFTSPPGHSPKITVETAEGRKENIIGPDNHFKNMLLHFYGLVKGEQGAEDEYRMNVSQARLIEELRQRANGRK